MNPRVLAWLRAVGLTPKDIERRSGGDVPRVVVAGEKNLWTAHYICWIGSRWAAWAKELGFKNGNHRDALLSGHSDDGFDLWLSKKG